MDLLIIDFVLPTYFLFLSSHHIPSPSIFIQCQNVLKFTFAVIIYSIMGYDDFDSESSSSIFSQMSGKKLAALAILIIMGAIFGVQVLFGFPLKDLIRK